MKTCFSFTDAPTLWERCKETLRKFDFQIVYESISHKKMSARRSNKPESGTIFLDLSLELKSNLLFLSVDAVQNDNVDGMLNTHSTFEMLFMEQVLNFLKPIPEENSFRLKSEDYY